MPKGLRSPTLQRNPPRGVASAGPTRSKGFWSHPAFDFVMSEEFAKKIEEYPEPHRMNVVAMVAALRAVAANEDGFFDGDDLKALVKSLRTSARKVRRIARHPLIDWLHGPALAALAELQDRYARVFAGIEAEGKRSLKRNLRGALRTHVAAALGNPKHASRIDTEVDVILHNIAKIPAPAAKSLARNRERTQRRARR